MDFVDKSSVQPMSMLSLAEELVAKIRAPRRGARAAPARARRGRAAERAAAARRPSAS